MSESLAQSYIPYVREVEGVGHVGYVTDPSGNWISASMNGWFIRLYQFQDISRDMMGVFSEDRLWYASFDRNPLDERYIEHSRVPHSTPWDALEYFAGWAAHIDGLIAEGASAAEILAAQTPPPAEEWEQPDTEDAEEQGVEITA